MKARDFMIGDWLQDEHAFPMYVTAVGTYYVYADFEGNEGDVWEYQDRDFRDGTARPVELRQEMLLANGFTQERNKWTFNKESKVLVSIENMDLCFEGMARLFALSACGKIRDFRVRYVHELQHILRLIGLSELANDFKLE
jgi:hypothetical protein